MEDRRMRGGGGRVDRREGKEKRMRGVSGEGSEG